MNDNVILQGESFAGGLAGPWYPVPKDIAKKYRITRMKLRVTAAGLVAGPTGLLRAEKPVADRWKEIAGVDSLESYTDESIDARIHVAKEGPVLRIAGKKDISLKTVVAGAFLENPLCKPCVAVLNGDPLDIRADNLMYMSRAEINRFTRFGVLEAESESKADLTYGLTKDGRYDYGSRVFTLYNVNGDVYMRILNTVQGQKAIDCAKLYFFIRYWGSLGIREFSGEDLAVHLGVSRKVAGEAAALLNENKFIRVSRELMVKHNGAYTYYALDVTEDLFDKRRYLDLSITYPCGGTKLDETLVEYVKSLRHEVYEPGYKSEWDKLHYEHPEYYYESKYGDLKYRFTTEADNLMERLKEAHFVAKCVSSLNKPYSYSSGRCYPAFARSEKAYRRGFEYNGSPLTELFDLHCSFYTLLTHLMGDSVPLEEKERFFERCIVGKLYDDCADYMNKGRKIKVTRDEVKDHMQAWRNDIKGSSSKGVREFMEDYYPNIRRLIDNWPTYIDRYGFVKKTIQRDCGAYETLLISELAFEITNKYNVSCFLLHDAIYVSEKEKAAMPGDIEDRILKWLKNKIL